LWAWTRVSGQAYLDDGWALEGFMRTLSFAVAIAAEGVRKNV
jgi:hypothetical protein